MGPGGREHRTYAAIEAVSQSEVVFGYTKYIDDAEDLLEGKIIKPSGMRQEETRVEAALAEAAEGKVVALICSGDAGVYGLAGLSLTFRNTMGLTENVAIEVVPGVTAALAAAAALGSPLTVDYATISLSDLLTSREVIRKRLTAATEADFVVALYNPRSNTRHEPWDMAMQIFLMHRDHETPCGIVFKAGTEQESARILTLNALSESADSVDMHSLVIIGNSQTHIIDNRLVTRRGYRGE